MTNMTTMNSIMRIPLLSEFIEVRLHLELLMRALKAYEKPDREACTFDHIQILINSVKQCIAEAERSSDIIFGEFHRISFDALDDLFIDASE